jgi:hypothetical protein
VEILIALGLKILPYLAILGVIVAGYLKIRHQGAVAERDRQEAAQVEAVKERLEKLQEAASKDQPIDDKVREQVEKIRKIQKDPAPFNPGDIFKF